MERPLPFSRRCRHLAEYLLFRILVCIMQILSPRQAAALARGLAHALFYWVPRKLTRYEVARQNIRTSFGDRYSDEQIDEMIHGMWVHLFRMIAEVIQLPRKVHRSNIFDVFEFHNRHLVVQSMCSGRPVILLSGHYGNWEMAVSAFGLFGMPMGVVARELDNPYLNRWFRRFRQITGHRMLAKQGDYDKIVQMAESRGHLAMLGDQDAGPRGVFVPFFGKPASTFKSIALLAIQFRALICVGYARRLPDDFENRSWMRFELGCEEVIDPLTIDSVNEVQEITRRYTAALERAIARAPEQYFWVHRRWKSEPKIRKKKQAASKAA